MGVRTERLFFRPGPGSAILRSRAGIECASLEKERRPVGAYRPPTGHVDDVDRVARTGRRPRAGDYLAVLVDAEWPALGLRHLKLQKVHEDDEFGVRVVRRDRISPGRFVEDPPRLAGKVAMVLDRKARILARTTREPGSDDATWHQFRSYEAALSLSSKTNPAAPSGALPRK
jgi:hypothetical protein